METRLRDILLLLLALLLFAVVVVAAVLLRRSGSQPEPAPPPVTRDATAPHTSAPGGTPPPSPPPDDATSTTAAAAAPSLTATKQGAFTTTPNATSRPETGTPTRTPTPGPSPTATVTPTPPTEPSARGPDGLLESAHRARRNGDYAAARADLIRLAAMFGNQPQATDARYQAGVLAYLDADYATARDLLEHFIATYPEDHRIAAAHFYRAEALARLGDYPPAIEHYETYLVYQDVLADVVYGRLGKIHRFLGDHAAAVEAYSQAVEHAPDLATELDLREQIASTYQAWGRYQEAASEFQAILDRSENPYRLARIWYRLGGNHRLLGEEEAALEAYAQAVNGDPRPGHAHMALVELVHAGVEVDEYQRGLIDYHVESYQAAIDAFARYMTSTPEYNRDAHYYIARSWLEQGDPAQAVQACEGALAEKDAESGSHSLWGDLWLLKAESLVTQGYLDQALDTYVEFADGYPDHGLAPEAMWQAARLLLRDRRHVEAADHYTALADRYPDDERAPEARFQAGLWRYWIGDVDAALGAWSELAATFPETLAGQRGRYWLGKTLWGRGLASEARYELEELAALHPRSYAGLRAAHLLAKEGQAPSWHRAPAALHLTSPEQEERRAVLDWLQTWTDLSAHSLEREIADELAGNLHFRRAIEMHTLGLRAQALDELQALRIELRERPDPLLLFQLALVARDLELYAPSLRAAFDLIDLAPQDSVLEMPTLVQRLAYPTYYADLVLAESQSYGLDPLLLFALIRQESIYDDRVESWAGAVGLTQIMPSTGAWIAEMTAWPEYDEALLQRAYLNVKFGAWFMDRILEQAEGDVITALAGYNGGPGLALRWKENAAEHAHVHGSGSVDPDLLVETIPKDETQQYVRAIYRHYDVYRHLYGE